MLITCIDRLLRIVKEQPITLKERIAWRPHQERLANHFSRQSNSSTGIGGGERDRTDDPLLAKQVLSQLSYTPNTAQRLTSRRRNSGGSGWIRTNDPRLIKTVL